MIPETHIVFYYNHNFGRWAHPITYKLCNEVTPVMKF